MIIRNCAPLANYYDDLISTVSDLSFQVTPEGGLDMLPHYPHPERQPAQFTEKLKNAIKTFRFSNRTKLPNNKDISAEEFFSQDPIAEEQLALEHSRPMKSDYIRPDQVRKTEAVDQTLREAENFFTENFNMKPEEV